MVIKIDSLYDYFVSSSAYKPKLGNMTLLTSAGTDINDSHTIFGYYRNVYGLKYYYERKFISIYSSLA